MLFLGLIPIVKTSPLDSLFAGLPVVILSDWSELATGNMSSWRGEAEKLMPVKEEVFTADFWI